jgi:hypothetical protein
MMEIGKLGKVCGPLGALPGPVYDLDFGHGRNVQQADISHAVLPLLKLNLGSK